MIGGQEALSAAIEKALTMTKDMLVIEAADDVLDELAAPFGAKYRTTPMRFGGYDVHRSSLRPLEPGAWRVCESHGMRQLVRSTPTAETALHEVMKALAHAKIPGQHIVARVARELGVEL